MGSSLSGSLFYGIVLGNSSEICLPEEVLDNDLEQPWREAFFSPPDGYESPEWDAWREKVKEFEASPRHVEIDFFGHGCGDGFVYAITSRALTQEANWDVSKPVVIPADLSEYDKWLAAYCEKFSLTYSQPKWYVGCLYF